MPDAYRCGARCAATGALELLLELPDGSRSLIPAAWIDQAEPAQTAAAPATVAALADLEHAVVLVAKLLARDGAPRVQLSLLPDQVPAPPTDLLAQLRESQVAAAIAVFAELIAKRVDRPPERAVRPSGGAGLAPARAAPSTPYRKADR